MKIPEELEIFRHRYTVRKDNKLLMKDDTVGTYCPYVSEITIDTNAPESKQQEAFLHEIIEAINNHLELKLEHKQITGLGTGLFHILSDNKLGFNN